MLFELMLKKSKSEMIRNQFLTDLRKMTCMILHSNAPIGLHLTPNVANAVSVRKRLFRRRHLQRVRHFLNRICVDELQTHAFYFVSFRGVPSDVVANVKLEGWDDHCVRAD